MSGAAAWEFIERDPEGAALAATRVRTSANLSLTKLLARIGDQAKREPRSRVRMHDLVMRGLPGYALETAKALTRFSDEVLALLLDIAPSALPRYAAKRRLTSSLSDRVARLLNVYMHAVSTLEDPSYASEWLNEPNERLGNLKPRELLRTDDGVRRVREALGAIEFGLPT